MSGSTDYLELLHSYSKKYTELYLSNFDYYLKFAGTTVVVRRVKDEDEFKKALGASYIFDGTSEESPPEVFKKKVVFNRSTTVPQFNGSSLDLEFYTNEQFFKMGDQIEFKLNNLNFSAKVADIDDFERGSNLLYRITLGVAEEYK